MLTVCSQCQKPFVPKVARSAPQNRYYWGVVLTMIADHTGHTTEEIHEWCKESFLPRRYVELAGKVRELPKSTTEMDIREFELYLERVRAFAGQELQMTIPLPNEV